MGYVRKRARTEKFCSDSQFGAVEDCLIESGSLKFVLALQDVD